MRLPPIFSQPLSPFARNDTNGNPRLPRNQLTHEKQECYDGVCLSS